MKWIKASERLPEFKLNEFGKKISPNGFYYCKCEGDVVDLCQYKEGWGEFRHITVGCGCTDYTEESANVVEWLDESPAPDGWMRFNEVDIANGLYDVWVEEIARPVRHYYTGGRWINQEKIMLPEYYGVEFIQPLPQPPKQ